MKTEDARSPTASPVGPGAGARQTGKGAPFSKYIMFRKRALKSSMTNCMMPAARVSWYKTAGCAMSFLTANEVISAMPTDCKKDKSESNITMSFRLCRNSPVGCWV